MSALMRDTKDILLLVIVGIFFVWLINRLKGVFPDLPDPLEPIKAPFRSPWTGEGPTDPVDAAGNAAVNGAGYFIAPHKDQMMGGLLENYDLPKPGDSEEVVNQKEDNAISSEWWKWAATPISSLFPWVVGS